MSTMLSRWPVVVTRSVTADDLDEHGHLSQAAVRRVGEEAVTALVLQAPLLAACERRSAPTSAQLNGSFGAPGPVTVSASAREVYPTSIEIAVRIRPTDGQPSSVDAVWTITVDAGVPTAVRDELIALVHAARHHH